MRALRARLAAAWATKVAVTAVMGIVFFVPYVAIQRLQGAPARVLPSTWIDRAIPFDPRWVWAYLSIYVLVPLVPWLLQDAGRVVRYLRGFVGACVVSYAVFLAFPASAPRPDVGGAGGAYRWLVELDGRGNAFPSLHAGLAIYALRAGRRLLHADAGPAARTAYGLLATLWAGAILHATIATRQHVAWDLVAGALVALAAESLAYRGDPVGGAPRTTPCTPVRTASNTKRT